MCGVGQNHIYTVCIRYIWQGIHHIYGHIWCIYTVLANPTHVPLPPHTLLSEHFRRTFRMSKPACNTLLRCLSKTQSCAVPFLLQIDWLYFWAGSGSPHQTLGRTYDVSKTAVCNIIHKLFSFCAKNLCQVSGGCFVFGRHVYFLGWTPPRDHPPSNHLIQYPHPDRKGTNLLLFLFCIHLHTHQDLKLKCCRVMGQKLR